MLTLNSDRLRQDCAQHPQAQAKKVYDQLLRQNPGTHALAEANVFLQCQLQELASHPCDLPTDPAMLPAWIANNAARVSAEYRRYLEARKTGAKRRYFRNKSHALYVLKGIAPTKMVDGAWLYGVLKHWDQSRYDSLINIYLEELGEGIPDKNHVVLYKKLLASHGCDQWRQLDASHFVQGALQLALGRKSERYLPEVIGYNLGYEQLPLHLLITAYELNELGIDPYYFTLHVTVDNAGSGHAIQALEALWEALPSAADQKEFYRRVRNGYKLSLAGKGTQAIIDQFNLRQELLDMLQQKAAFGAYLHSDYCRIAGKTINEWLAEPEQLSDFLDTLENKGWVKRHEDPVTSRFWGLLEGEGAQMFGVFNSYERQLIYDWISGDWAGLERKNTLSFRARQQLLGQLRPATKNAARHQHHAGRSVFREHGSSDSQRAEEMHDFNRDLRLLEVQLASLPEHKARMAHLYRLMSPAFHHTAAGLMATRIFSRLWRDR